MDADDAYRTLREIEDAIERARALGTDDARPLLREAWQLAMQVVLRSHRERVEHPKSWGPIHTRAVALRARLERVASSRARPSG